MYDPAYDKKRQHSRIQYSLAGVSTNPIPMREVFKVSNSGDRRGTLSRNMKIQRENTQDVYENHQEMFERDQSGVDLNDNLT